MNGVRVVVSGWRDDVWSGAGQITSGEVCRDVTWMEGTVEGLWEYGLGGGAVGRGQVEGAWERGLDPWVGSPQ